MMHREVCVQALMSLSCSAECRNRVSKLYSSYSAFSLRPSCSADITGFFQHSIFSWLLLRRRWSAAVNNNSSIFASQRAVTELSQSFFAAVDGLSQPHLILRCFLSQGIYFVIRLQFCANGAVIFFHRYSPLNFLLISAPKGRGYVMPSHEIP